MLVRALTYGRAMFRALPLLLMVETATVHGQEGRVEILNADEWSFDAAVNGAQLLRGNVRFKHANALMRCDSAYLFEDERVDAFGHVTIDQGDTLHVDADRLKYNGRERMARLEGNVRLRDRDMELTRRRSTTTCAHAKPYTLTAAGS